MTQTNSEVEVPRDAFAVLPPNVAEAPLALPGHVAAFLNMTEGALAQLRYTGRGPRFIKVSGRAVRYAWGDVLEWVEARTRQQTD